MRRALVLAVLVACSCGDDAPPVTFEGAYEDWDSTPQDFLGIPDATVVEVGNESNTATTPPNGRFDLTLPGDGESVLTLTADGFLPARYTLIPANTGFGVKGITPARIATYYTEIGAGAWDEGTALVEVRITPGFTATVDGEAGTEYGELLVWPNTAVGDGTVSVEVGTACHGPERVHVAAGEVAITVVACEDPI
jgi:hypothetical protein